MSINIFFMLKNEAYLTLKINSLVHNSDMKICSVKELSLDYLILLCEGETTKTYYEAISPITLTTRWLVNFGFRKIGEKDYFLGKYFIHNRKRGWIRSKAKVPVIYVHQLQMSYLSDTGMQLDLNNIEMNLTK